MGRFILFYWKNLIIPYYLLFALRDFGVTYPHLPSFVFYEVFSSFLFCVIQITTPGLCFGAFSIQCFLSVTFVLKFTIPSFSYLLVIRKCTEDKIPFKIVGKIISDGHGSS
jgi:hypothetical protein